jgi:hypothetical protein
LSIPFIPPLIPISLTIPINQTQNATATRSVSSSPHLFR